MKLTVTNARPTDEKAVIALWQACGLVKASNDPVEDFHFALGKANSEILVGQNALGLIVATAMVGHDGHRGWIYYLAVDPKNQRLGFGRHIFSAAEQWIVDRGVPKVNLMVRETNTAVIGFYEKLGFSTQPIIVMGKRLTK